MPRRYADGFTRFGAISTRRSFVLGETLSMRRSSCCVSTCAEHLPSVRMYVHLLYSSPEGQQSAARIRIPTQIDRRAFDG